MAEEAESSRNSVDYSDLNYMPTALAVLFLFIAIFTPNTFLGLTTVYGLAVLSLTTELLVVKRMSGGTRDRLVLAIVCWLIVTAVSVYFINTFCCYAVTGGDTSPIILIVELPVQFVAILTAVAYFVLSIR